MVLDYRERKPVNKNRPKSKPVGLFVIAFGLVAVCSFALGALTDRFLLSPRSLKVENAQAPPSVAPKNGPQEQPSSTAKDSVTAKQGAAPALQEPSLTFYETLPKGGKIILGSGMNPKTPKVLTASPAKTATEALPKNDQVLPRQTEAVMVQKADKPAISVSSPEKSAAADNAERPKAAGETAKEVSAKKTAVSKGKFSVQVASAKERKEADAIKSGLQEKGFAAYVVESVVPGKGTWYRVRVGKQMDQSSAAKLAKQLGKAAIIIPE
ncbi:SPOR domain-containing protein [Geobacter grbiciae]|uniref:SPOR domain-containing protein n=1 Tax=Geobacter grbiciae TaxID=155042 RepID=UPI001C019FEE|nr:SPOR domain-containing protein [Geobacter grbiciae]MBT1076729.1 SPOR domain-containing protein [Geobacter grbiciae]